MCQGIIVYVWTENFVYVYERKRIRVDGASFRFVNDRCHFYDTWKNFQLVESLSNLETEIPNPELNLGPSHTMVFP